VDALVTLHEGDCLEVLAGMPDASIDAVVTDPPYSLSFMGRSWDTFKPSEFQAWCEKWAGECLRVLKPGGYLLAFGGTRTYHRLACGIEDAGFEVRDSLHWIYGQGFPKGKAALKPSHEPIVMARKPDRKSAPLPGLDDCRVEGVPPSVPQPAFNSPTGQVYGMKAGTGRNGAMSQSSQGRWPPNVLLSEEAAAEMDRQSGNLAGCGGPKKVDSGATSMFGIGAVARTYEREGGGASRFFPVFRYQAKASSKERPRLPDGTAWPTVKPLELMRWLVRLVTPPGGTVLDPFAGTGTTAQAAALEGFSCVLAEKDPVAVALIRQRLAKPLQPSLLE
jgi:site-specific DNA-methyltransferase (adenine-specific)